MIKWIMGCVTSSSFVVLISGSCSEIFRPSRGLQQGCSLFPYLFLLVVKGLGRTILHTRRQGRINGMSIGRNEHLTHFLFMGDVLLFCLCSKEEGRQYKEILQLFNLVMGMEINMTNSIMCIPMVEAQLRNILERTFPFPTHDVSEGLKSLGYTIKPSNYGKDD